MVLYFQTLANTITLSHRYTGFTGLITGMVAITDFLETYLFLGQTMWSLALII